MKVSVITVVFNGAPTIGETLASVDVQTHPDIEHIVVDGASTDGTLNVIKQHGHHVARLISEPDRGIYDAMNKGILLATGEIVGILNADDVYAHSHVLEDVIKLFEETSIDACFGDLVYVDRQKTDQVIRYWKSKPYHDGLFEKGWMPPHPTFFVRRKIYNLLGLFDLNFNIAADVELLMRFIAKHRIKTAYLPQILVKMRVGGTTNRSWTNIIKQNLEIYKAAHKNGLKLSPFFVLYKFVDKITQFYKRPAHLS